MDIFIPVGKTPNESVLSISTVFQQFDLGVDDKVFRKFPPHLLIIEHPPGLCFILHMIMVVQNETLFILIADLFPASNVVDKVVFKNGFTVQDRCDGQIKNIHGLRFRSATAGVRDWCLKNRIETQTYYPIPPSIGGLK